MSLSTALTEGDPRGWHFGGWFLFCFVCSMEKMRALWAHKMRGSKKSSKKQEMTELKSQSTRGKVGPAYGISAWFTNIAQNKAWWKSFEMRTRREMEKWASAKMVLRTDGHLRPYLLAWDLPPHFLGIFAFLNLVVVLSQSYTLEAFKTHWKWNVTIRVMNDPDEDDNREVCTDWSSHSVM